VVDGRCSGGLFGRWFLPSGLFCGLWWSHRVLLLYDPLCSGYALIAVCCSVGFIYFID